MPEVRDTWLRGVRALAWLEQPAFFLFGLTPWLGINGIFVEGPLLVKTLPEGPKLLARAGIAAQVGNLFPLLYIVLREQQRIGERYIVLLQQLAAPLLSLVAAALWSSTLDGVSVALLLVCLCSGAVGCTANITFQAFSVRFRLGRVAQYWANAGLCASGLVPVLVGARQMLRGAAQPAFDVSTYLAVISAVQLAGAIATVGIIGPRQSVRHLCKNTGPPVAAGLYSPSDVQPSPLSEETAPLVHLDSVITPGPENRSFSMVDPAVSSASAIRRFWRDALYGQTATGALLPKIVSETANYAFLPGMLPFLCSPDGVFLTVAAYYCCGVAAFFVPEVVRGTRESAERVLWPLAMLEAALLVWLAWSAADPSKAAAYSVGWVAACVLPASGIGFLNAFVAKNTYAAIDRIIPKDASDEKGEAINHAAGLTTQFGAALGTTVSLVLVETGTLVSPS
eukprot:TRINITY_DN47182_c0_g1_i1.p1 TRINITY_DN47182_c0_g1~~TRINITY_DN47182_c0_g1_i1.p1  ORF type:complete len:453 (+),score=128.37 TRINITY_DN47182_c0_g1_i1:55-1413(+)